MDAFVTMVIVVCYVVLFWLGYRVRFDAKHSFLFERQWFEKRSIAELADDAIGFWARQLLHAGTQEQRDYCFRKAWDSQKEMMSMEGSEQQPSVETLQPAEIPDNIIKFPDLD